MILNDHNSPFIRVLIKRPGEALRAQVVENTLEALQNLVGGHIESITACTDLAIICNEEGRLLGLPHNMTLLGVDFAGPIAFVGVRGEDFMSITRAGERLVRRLVEEVFKANAESH